MTVKELTEKLAEYPDEMRVKLAIGWNMDSLDVIGTGVDIDTNEVSLWLCSRRDRGEGGNENVY